MNDRKLFEDGVTLLPDEPGPTARGLMVQAAEPENLKQQMTVLFSLEISVEGRSRTRGACGHGVVVSH